MGARPENLEKPPGASFSHLRSNKKGLQKDRPASAEEEIRTHPNGPQVMYCY